MHRGIGEGDGITQEVWSVLSRPIGILVAASNATHYSFRAWPTSSVVGVYFFEHPTSYHVSPPPLSETLGGFNKEEPLLRVSF